MPINKIIKTSIPECQIIRKFSNAATVSRSDVREFSIFTSQLGYPSLLYSSYKILHLC